MQQCEPRDRNPCAPKFEDWTLQEKPRNKKEWDLANNVLFPLRKKPKEQEFVVDSGATMHMLGKKDLSSSELDTLRKSRNSTTVITAAGEMRTNEEAQAYTDEILIATVQILNDTPAVLSPGKLCEEHGCSYEWTEWSKATSDPTMGNNFVQDGTCRSHWCPRIVVKLQRKFAFYIDTKDFFTPKDGD